MVFKEHTDEELKQIAIDLHSGRIYCDRHIEDTSDIRIVFMPVMLGAFADAKKEELDNIGMIYEYLTEAGPRCVNGMPTFFSLKYLSKKDTMRMSEYYEKLVEAVKNL